MTTVEQPSGSQEKMKEEKKESYFSRGDDNQTMFSDGLTDFGRKNHPPHDPTGSTEVLTFYPTLNEFKDFNGYIAKIEAVGAHSQCGICKIVPPEGWSPRPSKTNFDDVDSYVINCPVKEIMTPTTVGVYQKLNEIYKKEMRVKEFRALARSVHYKPPAEFAQLKGREMEDYFFNHMTERTPIYGADTEGSIYDHGIEEFNMNNLGTILNEYKEKVKGVNTAYLYFGMYKTCFPWHAEDMDLYSINYLHFGAPKFWYAIPAEAADRFETLLDQLYPEWKKQCPAFPRHKLCMVSPEVLRIHNIPFGTMMQNPNEFIITFPRGYHMGFNTGYNCAESTNFATDRWIDYGKNVLACKCIDSVRLKMEPFMELYRGPELSFWLQYWYDQNRPKYLSTAMVPYPCPDPPPKYRCTKGESRWTEAAKKIKRKRGDWKKRLPHLFARFSPNLFLEKSENETAAYYPPHCAVCRLFVPRDNTSKEAEIPKRSKRLSKSLFFAKENLTVKIEDPEEDHLITCSNCLVTVHPSCYGGEYPGTSDWKCFRCRDRNDIAIRHTTCRLCEMRGGALLPCETGIDVGFVHVICAIMNRRTAFDRSWGPRRCKNYPALYHLPRGSFLGVLKPQYIALEGEATANFRWNCDICDQMKEGLIVCNLCSEDNVPREQWTLAHTTCGKAAGFFFEEREAPQCMVMICDKHEFDSHGDALDIFLPGSTVYMKYGKEVLDGIVQELFEEIRLSVSRLYVRNGFDDSVREEAVVCCNCESHNDDHKEGAKLRIKNKDGTEEECYFRSSYCLREYSVRLSNGVVEDRVPRQQLIGPRDKIGVALKRKIAQI